MKTLHGYHGFSGAVLLVLCYGLFVQAEDITDNLTRAAGSSLILLLGSPNESVSFVQWKYEGKPFASYRNQQIFIINKLQFGERLQVDNVNLRVEVTDLQLSDSGIYSVVTESKEDQLPTKMMSLTVHGMLEVKIESKQFWKESTNSCEVRLLCQAPEDQNVSYTWSGFKTGSEALLNLTLLPAYEEVTLTCTADSSLGKGSKMTNVMCKPTPSSTGVNELPWIWIASGGGAALFLLIAITAVGCWWKSHKVKSPEELANTVYADVNINTVRKDSMNCGSIYETVDETRINPEKPHTLYDKVTFTRPTLSGPSASSPYQDVL